MNWEGVAGSSASALVFRRLSASLKAPAAVFRRADTGSRTVNLIRSFAEKLKLCFEYSALNKITLFEWVRPELLSGSLAVERAAGLHRACRRHLAEVANSSVSVCLLKKSGLYSATFLGMDLRLLKESSLFFRGVRDAGEEG